MVKLKKIKSATLVETIVAMSILSVVSGMAIMVFLMVSKPSSSSGSMILAQQKSAEILDTIQNGFVKRGLPFSWEVHNLQLETSITDYAENIREVEVEVKDNEQRLIYTRRRLYYWHE